MRILLIAAAAALAIPLTAVHASPPTTEAQFAEVRLPHISITTIGQGPAVVLIPGLSSPRAAWHDTAAQLRGGHKLILVQVNGFAGDDPGANLKPGILDGIIADLHGYLEREKIGRAKFVGHSMGGLAGLLFAARHPNRIESLMIVDSLPFFSVLMDPNITVEQAKPIASMTRDKIAASYGKPVDPEAVEASVKNQALKPSSLARVKAWAAAADPRVTAGALYEDMVTDARPLLPAINTPITVVVPWSDTLFGRERTLAFYAAQYAGAADIRYADIGDAGHFVMLDQPEAFHKALDEFLAK